MSVTWGGRPKARPKASHIIIALVLTILLVVLAATRAEPQTCYEDMDCWNCQVMGNQICGSG